MTRTLPRHLSNNQQKILTATLEFFGDGASSQEKSRAKKIALWIMGRRKNNKLTEEEMSSVFYIKNNLADY